MAHKSEAEVMARGLDNVCTGIVWLLLAVIGFFATLPSGMSNAWWIAAIAFLAGCYAISGSGPFARLLRTPGTALAFLVRSVLGGGR
ncbi:hypothetical protein [Paradevosia shaoguanensis]|uniref:hypothetical protein n=1 Tax=Paradevosia shaoguanensis TaxID=1335043 RepID=UPI003C781DF0